MSQCETPQTNASTDCTERIKSCQRGASVTPMTAHTKVIPEEQHAGMKRVRPHSSTNTMERQGKKISDPCMSLFQPQIERQAADLRNTAGNEITQQAITVLDCAAPLPGIGAQKLSDPNMSLLQPQIERQAADMLITPCDEITQQAIIALECGAPLPGIAAQQLFDPLFPSNSPIEPKRLTHISPILAAVREARLEDRRIEEKHEVSEASNYLLYPREAR